MLVVHTKATANIDGIHLNVMTFQLVLQVVDAVAKSLEVAHLKDLRSDVEVQPREFHVFQTLGMSNHFFHVTHGNTEFVFGQTGGDIGVCMCAHIGIDAEGHTRYGIALLGQFVDDFKFGYALYVESRDTQVKT